MIKKPLDPVGSLVKIVTEAPANVPTQNRTIAKLTIPNGPLTLQVFNPGSNSVFAVSSTLIIGPTEVALVDAQFQRNDAEDLVKLIKSCGKKLTLVYISHNDPDFYFGSEVIQKAFPECQFYATMNTIDLIERTKALKLAFWSPTLKDNAPKSIVVPKLLPNFAFTVDGHKVEVRGPVLGKTYCWVPSMKAVLGGIPVCGTNVHLWLADDQTTSSRTDWYTTLTSIENLYPDIVIPSHFYPGIQFTIHNVEFTEQYLSEVEKVLPRTQNSAQFEAAIQKQFPDLQGKLNLETSAKVLKGEMKWPQ